MTQLKWQARTKRYVNSTGRCMVDLEAGVATSYGWWTMAKRTLCGTWIVAAKAYSVTTGQHISAMASALAGNHGYTLVYATNIDSVVEVFNNAFQGNKEAKALKEAWLREPHSDCYS